MSSSSDEEEFEFKGDEDEVDNDDDDHAVDVKPPAAAAAAPSSLSSFLVEQKAQRKRKAAAAVTATKREVEEDEDKDDASAASSSDDDRPVSNLKTKQKKTSPKIKIRMAANKKKPKLEKESDDDDDDEDHAEEEEDQDDDDEDDEDGDFDAPDSPAPKKKAKAAAGKSKKPAAAAKAAKTKAKTKKTSAAKAVKPDKTSSSSGKSKKSTSTAQQQSQPNQRELKKLDRTERLTYAMQSFLWWDAVDPPAGCQWVTMEHAGVAFPEKYQPHGVRLLYDGQPVSLTPEQEEAATFFAATDPDGMHLGNPTTAKIFIKNFFEDFRAILGKKHIIQKFEKCDFALIRSHLEEQKIVRKAATDQERKTVKEDKSQALLKYGYAIVDGHLERVGNFNMEPPGTFRGRGVHPKMGRLKSRVSPEQVSLNLSECAPVPICHVPGHAWGDLRHDPRGQWLATWKENINNQVRF
jgi:DNA topoisomerase IB